jgi:hypothetical protein
MSLLIVGADVGYKKVRRQGRFTVPRDLSKSESHLLAAVADAQELMIKGLESQGFRYVDDGFELRGPYPHILFSNDIDADPGPQSRPNPRDKDAMERWDRAEKSRIAKKTNAEQELVDFVLVGSFLTRRSYNRVVGGSQVWTP